MTSRVALTAVSSRSATDAARSGSTTFPVSGGPCGCSGPSVSGAAGPGLHEDPFTAAHPLAGPRAKLTARAAAWATDALQGFDTSVSALAHQLGVSWHTAWDAIKAEATRRIATADRLTGVNALGVDEHVWSHTGPPGTGMVTGMVDHTRDAHGVVHARLLDLVPGRSGKAYADWLKTRGPEFTAGIKTAALDPFRGYANAIRDELPEAITVLDAFYSDVLVMPMSAGGGWCRGVPGADTSA